MKKPIAFDLDGTLFEAHLLGLPAYKDTFTRLQAANLIQEVPGDDQLKSLFGMTEKEIWMKMLPGASAQTREMASDWMAEEEHKYLEQGAGTLFPGVRETLEELDRLGHPLFVVSNGTEGYVKSVCASFGLSLMLTGIYSAGEYQTETKTQLLEAAIAEHKLSPGVMVGDRGYDITAGLDNEFVTVGCTYGYGKREELVNAHYIVDDIRQVVTLAGKE